MQHDLRHDGVDSAVEDPALDGESERGERKVRISAEEDVGDETICPPFPL